jgi:acyl-CoA reductase-like NAD-dependent aldehyde dehydrogenase
MTDLRNANAVDGVASRGHTERDWKSAAGLLSPGMVIGSEIVDARSGANRDVLNPANGSVVGRVPEAGAEDVDDAVQVARRTFESHVWSGMSPADRAKRLHAFADAMEAALDDLYVLESLNNGRPVTETHAQMGRIGEYYRYTASLLVAQRDAMIPSSGPHHVYLRRAPLGVCGILTPFNHPLLILAQSLSGALATGNCVVVKPSELTPLTTLYLARLALECGIPAGVLNVVTGGHEAGAALVGHHGVAKINFTGGEAGGRAVGAAAAGRIARVTTELGGKSPVMVFDDADLDTAVNGAAFGAFVAAGQTCIAGSRLLVQETVYDEVVERLAAKAAAIRLGDPSDPRTQMGPVISRERMERILEYVQIGRDEGATVLTGGGRPDLPEPLDRGYFIEPTVISGVRNSMTVAQEEIFGPVVVAIPFKDERDAIAQANDSRFALGASVWTSNVGRAHRVAAAVEAGIFWVNDHHRLEPSMPWGGTKASGVGKESGLESFEEFTQQKAVIVNTEVESVDWYGDGVARLN